MNFLERRQSRRNPEGRPRGRPPHPDVLTPAEWRVLEEVRRGHTNAEIAARTGLSFNTVKTHIANMLVKTGTRDRRELAGWQGRPAEAPRRLGRGFALPLAGWSAGAKVVGGVVAAAVFLGAVWIVFEGLGGDGTVDAAVAFEARGMEQDAAFTRDDLDALGFVDTGRLFDPGGGAPLVSLVRPGFTVVPVAAGTALVLDEGWTTRAPSLLSFRVELDGVPYLATVDALDPHGYAYGGNVATLALALNTQHTDGRLVAITLDRPGEAMLRVRNAEGVAHIAIVDVDGHVWIDPAPVEGVITNTGEAIDTSRMTEVGRWREGQNAWYRTWCGYGTEPRCTASSGGIGPATAPFDGHLACDEHPELDTDRFILSNDQWAIELVPIGGGATCPDALPAALLAGERLPATGVNWMISNAWDAEGHAVDVVLDDDGRLFLGDADAQLLCPPCIGGN